MSVFYFVGILSNPSMPVSDILQPFAALTDP